MHLQACLFSSLLFSSLLFSAGGLEMEREIGGPERCRWTAGRCDWLFCSLPAMSSSRVEWSSFLSVEIEIEVGERKMSCYFDDHNCQPLGAGETPNHSLHLARLLLDGGYTDEFQMEFEDVFGLIDGRKQPPASKEFLRQLKSCTGVSPTEKCSICLREFGARETKVLPCTHRFCSSCLLRWLELINTCPLCRREFPTDDQDYETFKERKLQSKQREEAIELLHQSMFS